ncbi:MAG: CDP-diacylglycerol--glycerol-3-phosphate 3-phosphatidyltransferase [Actinobacteria bacterium]|nr:CDP-diacylglycerol--glycerol-3-phosphate 3-phosphatidyltransferase [Actinomycetota bacterium]
MRRRDDPQARQVQASAWNIANAITILRMALVPVFAWLLLYEGGRSTSYRLFAFGVFAFATATDRVDGYVARSRGLVTDFGKVSDPIADKALIGMALIGLSLIDLLPWWVTIVVLVREVGVTALRFVVIRHGVMPASRGGKVKTALQATAIMLYVLPLDAFPLSGFWQAVAVVIMAAAVIVAVATGVDYLLRAHTLRNTSPRARAKRRRRAAADLKAAELEAAALEAAARRTAGPKA